MTLFASLVYLLSFVLCSTTSASVSNPRAIDTVRPLETDTAVNDAVGTVLPKLLRRQAPYPNTYHPTWTNANSVNYTKANSVYQVPYSAPALSYYSTNTGVVEYRPAQNDLYGNEQDESEDGEIDRTVPALLAEIWPVAFSYAKWAVVRSLIVRPMTKFIFSPVFRFLGGALFPLGIDRFILLKWVPFPILSLMQAFLYRKFEHMIFRGVTNAVTYVYNAFFRR